MNLCVVICFSLLWVLIWWFWGLFGYFVCLTVTSVGFIACVWVRDFCFVFVCMFV